jgi:hypothetical protein
VLNNFAGWACTDSIINIMSGSLPFRPLLYINDFRKLTSEIIEKDIEKISRQAFNIGINKRNYSILYLAKKFKKI